MALVKVIGIKATPKATIKYIENKEKTMQEELITGINTIPDPGVASNKMKMYRDRYQIKNKVECFHIVHSFSNKEKLDLEKAHETSLSFIKEAFPESIISVAATHTKTDTLHTHFLVNNVTLDGQKIVIDKAKLNELRNISNEVCREYGLKYSIVENKAKGKGRGDKAPGWYEYSKIKEGTSWKQKIREDIDRLIPKAKDLDSLYSLLEKEGYEVNTSRKYTTVRPLDKERPVRLKTLGYNYDPEQLKNRILGLDKFDLPEKGYYAKGYSHWIDKDVYRFKYKKASIGTVIQLTGKIIAASLGKYENNPRYARRNYKAEKELKAIERALLTIQSNEFNTREEVVKVYNGLENELQKINNWKSKAQKKMDEINNLAAKLNSQMEQVNMKEQELKLREEDLRNVLNTFDRCRNKEYQNIYKENEPIR